MKILFISNLLPPHFIGGYEIACFDTFKLFKKNDVDCMILTSDIIMRESASVDMEYENKQTIFRVLKMHTDFKDSENCSSYKEVEKHNVHVVNSYIKTYNPDLVYFWNLWGLGSRIINCSKPEKSIFHIMDLSIKLYDFSWQKYLKFIILKNRPRPLSLKSNLKNIIFISDFVSQKFNNYHIKNQKTIYPFLENFETEMTKKTYQNSSNLFKGVFLGQVEIHKGILDLCNVLQNINSEFGFNKVSLDIYGSSRSDLVNLLRNQFDFINFFEKTPRFQILKNLKLYDFGFFPSLWEEPFGIAQIEMMAAGLPVLSSGRGGSSEPLNSNNSIIYSNSGELKKSLLDLISNYPFISKRIGENARKEVALKFSESTYYSKIISFFKEVIDNK